MYRILMDQFMGFLPDTNNVTTNYTGGRGMSLLIRDEEYRHGSFIELVVRIIISNTIKSMNLTINCRCSSMMASCSPTQLKSTFL